ncbi:MAG: hypothetical protein QOG05_5157 [Streptosporangiaceae bacterium]|nr:hypothetical protein [Streptosporangiaceae bacterium]
MAVQGLGTRVLVSRGADKAITDAIDRHVKAEQDDTDDEDGGAAGVLVPLANGPLMARQPLPTGDDRARDHGPDLGPTVERVTRIELALSAWESDRSPPLEVPTSQDRAPPVPVTDPSLPWLIAR